MARVEGVVGDGPAAALLCEAQMKSSWQIVTRVAADDGGEAEVVPSLPLSSQFITSDWHSVHA
eukprot:scaffold3569_cov200-Alexandrium_tamarense.AAC.7